MDNRVEVRPSDRRPTVPRRLLFIGLPIAIILAAAVTARATIDTSWIVQNQPLSSAKLKADLDDAEKRLAALEARKVTTLTLDGGGNITAQDGAWINGTSPLTPTSAGNYTIMINTGVFTASPTCTCSAASGSAFMCTFQAFPTTSTIKVQTIDSTGTPGTKGLSLICVGH